MTGQVYNNLSLSLSFALSASVCVCVVDAETELEYVCKPLLTKTHLGCFTAAAGYGKKANYYYYN